MYKTLDDFRGSFLFQSDCFKHINMKELSVFMNENRDALHVRNPEDYALDFYLLNHSVFHISNKFSRNENLDEEHAEYMKFYVNKTLDIFTSAFLYLMCITTKESRHMLYSGYGDDVSRYYEEGKIDDIERLGYTECFNFTKYLRYKKGKTGYGGSRALLDTTHVPDVSIQTYLNYLRFMYTEWTWEDQYGGHVWGTITDVLCRFVNGEITPETLVDNMWTLSHNNGLIFNKKIVFANYQDEQEMIEILNAQAVGRLPEYVDNTNPYVGNSKGVYRKVKSITPEIFELKTSFQDLMTEIENHNF